MRFNYVQYDKISTKTQEEFKEMFEKLEKFANEALPDSREKSLFMTALEEAYMWTGKAIRNEQIKRGVQVEHAPRRSFE